MFNRKRIKELEEKLRRTEEHISYKNQYVDALGKAVALLNIVIIESTWSSSYEDKDYEICGVSGSFIIMKKK